VDGTAPTPFGPELTTIPLQNPPLALVLVQVRFAPILSIQEEEFVGGFQEAIREAFPVAKPELEVGVDLSQTPPAVQQSKLWRFATADGMSRASLGSAFVAFETRNYAGHEKFFSDLSMVLTALAERVKPAQVQRTGIRYIQRLSEPEDLERIDTLFVSPIVGIAASEAKENLELVLAQSRHRLDGANLAARWGLIPAGVTPEITEALETPSWVFDIDVFDDAESEFDAAELVERLYTYSRYQYRFFRWSVTKRFLERFGASEQDLADLEGGDQ
jgi:uncharacterized protein (TIGR04255 family)